MNNVLGQALEKAFDGKVPSTKYVWKGEKRKVDDKYVQDIEYINDMTPARLKQCYKHCDKMLNNTNPENLGRYNVLNEVEEQIQKCNTELCLRYFENKYKYDENRGAVLRGRLNFSLRQLQATNPEIEDWSLVKVSAISNDLPEEFDDVAISDLLDGCIYCLGAFDKKHLTRTFITKMGIWFSKAEINEIGGKNMSNKDRLKLVKEKLHLPEKLNLRLNEKGLSYHEMRAILSLPKKQRYQDMTTDQLVILRDKILFRLARKVDGHIYNWKKLQKQIVSVAKEQGINLND